MLARCSALVCASLLACQSPSAPPPVVESELLPPPAASTQTSAGSPLAKPTIIDLSVTDRAGRGMRSSLETKAFASCLTGAEPGESGYALFGAPLDGSNAGPRKLLETEGLTPATLACIGTVLAAYQESSFLVRDTFWYVSLQP